MSAGEGKAEKVSYDAKCHCGATTYTVKIPSLEHHEVTNCNCSICTSHGYLLVYPDPKDVVFHSGYDQLKTYCFGRQTVDHKFCPTCGSSLLIKFKGSEDKGSEDKGSEDKGSEDKGSEDKGSEDAGIAINVRMFKDIDPDKLKLQHFDGKTELP